MSKDKSCSEISEEIAFKTLHPADLVDLGNFVDWPNQEGCAAVSNGLASPLAGCVSSRNLQAVHLELPVSLPSHIGPAQPPQYMEALLKYQRNA